MDLLASLHVDDLPEQQTRTVDLMSRHPDFDLALGFDACCTCGNSLDKATTVVCRNCRRVSYCSLACRDQDASVTVAVVQAEEEEETALGHNSVVCALLKLCNDDEAIDENQNIVDLDEREAAQDRVRSESESYPATLANVIAEGPCYQDVLRKASSRKKLVLHVIGAATDSELWDEQDGETGQAWGAYAEALAELASSRSFHSIELVFVGPECPKQNLQVSRSMRLVKDEQKVVGELVMHTYRSDYNEDFLSHHSKADIVVFFNPGFTVPDYDWSNALACIEKGTPFLSTTNTELEGIADSQYLLDQDRIQTMPPGLAEIFGLHVEQDEEEEDNTTSFFSVNPFSGLRVRQSGTMANDLYVKNRWMLGGVLDSFDPSKNQKDGSSKKQRMTNEKIGNPALI
jgi:hypothetical protein